MKESVLKEYEYSKPTLEDFKKKMESLISDFLRDESINVHQITGRLKGRASLENKIEKKRDKYSSLLEITDVVGLRIITYLESDVDVVASIIEREFCIDKDHSIDKRKLKSDQFGYRSLHFVASCSKERSNLFEYKRFNGFKFEIQIRSILQHAWAEIEHDLGYKGITSIPDAYKRNFNRLAALLELADLEFDRLKKDLDKYESEVAELIQNHPENVAIDQASLMSFVNSNSQFQQALEIIRTNVGCEFRPDNDYQDYIDRFINFFNINTIESLDRILATNEKLFLEFIKEFTKDFNYSELRQSVVIYYFQHFLSALKEDQDYVQKYLDFGEVNISSENGRFINIIKKAKLKIM